MIIEVPYFSQILDVGDPYWQERSCSITCLKMLLEFYKNGIDMPSIDGLIEEGIIIGGHSAKGVSDVGWKQSSIVALARNHGLSGYNQEFRSIEVDINEHKFKESKYQEKIFKEGIEKIIEWLKSRKPVIVSVPKNFNGDSSPHTILLAGFAEDNGDITGFYYHDSNFSEREEGQNRFVDIQTFKNKWRRMAIFLNKV